jgi:hypothetical protein
VPVGLSAASPVRLAGERTIDLRAGLADPALVFARERESPEPERTTCRRTEMVRLRFQPADSGDLELSRDLAIENLELYERPDPGGDLASTLLSGQFRLSATKAGPTALFPNDLLNMGRSSGRMRTITMGEKATKFDFQGVVRELSIGSSESRRSAMPSLLEWWLSRDRIWIAWSAGVSAIAFLAGVYRWVQKRG